MTLFRINLSCYHRVSHQCKNKLHDFFLRLGSLDIWPTRETSIKKKRKQKVIRNTTQILKRNTKRRTGITLLTSKLSQI